MKTILHVVGARPNFIKTAPIMAALARYPEQFRQLLVHTGQHYDYAMSRVFFEELALPDPDEFLSVGSGSHAEQTARVLLAFEPVLLRHRPDWVMVVGDVNSTLACALACSKLGVPVAHVEAGLRSGDRTMPEEINRLLTDRIADLLLTPSRDADANLRAEGVADAKICFVGNVMIDTLVRMLPHADRRPILAALGLTPGGYVLATLHRPANVDNPIAIAAIMEALERIATSMPVVFPVHPRTRQRLDSLGRPPHSGLRLVEPLGYLDFLALQRSARLVITDSGGVQEETTYLGVPCLTVRPNTERPITITEGTNRLVAGHAAAIIAAVEEVLAADRPAPRRLELWDGHTAERVVAALLERA